MFYYNMNPNIQKLELIYYNKIIHRKQNIFSFSLFKIMNPYRKFDKYLNYLSVLLKILPDKFPDFDLRVYFDESCSDEIKKLIAENKNIEFVKFNYQKIRINKYHNGLFGSLVRFLPLFSHEYNYVWIADVDLNPAYLEKKIFEFVTKNNVDTFYSSKKCYNKPWATNKYPIMAGTILTKIKINDKIFYKFIYNVINGKYQKIIDEIVKYRTDTYKYDYKILFPYGIDELFCNKIMVKYLITNNSFARVDTSIGRILVKTKFINDGSFSNSEIDNFANIIEYDYFRFTNEDQQEIKEKFTKALESAKKINYEKLIHLYADKEPERVKCINDFMSFIENKVSPDTYDFMIYKKVRLRK